MAKKNEQNEVAETVADAKVSQAQKVRALEAWEKACEAQRAAEAAVDKAAQSVFDAIGPRMVVFRGKNLVVQQRNYNGVVKAYVVARKNNEDIEVLG